MRPSPFPRLPFWALLVPLAYAPSLVLGAPPSPVALAVLIGATGLAAAAVWLGYRTTILDRLALRLGRAAPWLLAVGVLVYAGVSAAVSREGLRTFSPQLSQLGLYTQSTWTTLHGHVFANTHETVDASLGSHFGIHFSPTLLLLVPLYALWPSPLALMAAQALAVGLAAVPLFVLLRRNAGAAGALVIALALLLLPAFAAAGTQDFHDGAFLPLCLLCAVWALESRRPAAFLVAALAALGVREDTGLVLVALGAWALLRGLGARTAALTALLGVVWLAVAVRVVIPEFWSPGLWTDPSRFVTQHFGEWGATPVDVARNMATHPVAVARQLLTAENARYLYTLLRPTLLFPPLADAVWIGAAPGLAVNLLSARGWQRDALFYYSLVPLLFAYLAAARAASRLPGRGPEPRRSGLGLAAGLVVLAGIVPSLALSPLPPLAPGPPASAAERVVRALPRSGALYVPVGLYPSVAARDTVACWESVGARGRAPEMRDRFRWIVLWPAGDPPGGPRDAPLAAALAADPRFEPLPQYAPLVVFRHR